MYKAIIAFTDLKDGNHSYLTGDEYPREGYSPTEQRVKELLSSTNKLGEPVIKYIEPEKVEKKKRGRKNT